MIEFKNYITRAQVAKQLDISLGRVSQVIKVYNVPFIKLGNNSLFLKSDVEKLEKQREKNMKFKGDK